MSSNHADGSATPDYDLEDVRRVSTTPELRAVFDPLRATLLDLLLERAATVGELAEAVGRPRSTVAYHVQQMVAAGVLQVVRTRRVRAIEERFYGRTARTYYVGVIAPDQLPLVTNYLPIAAAESEPAHRADDLRANLRYSRIPTEQVEPFWRRVQELVDEFSRLPRTGERTWGFVTGLYPTTARPALPPGAPDHEG
jgi:DNA-binding transcriptional ArsR family regulator